MVVMMWEIGLKLKFLFSVDSLHIYQSLWNYEYFASNIHIVMTPVLTFGAY